MRGKGEGAVYRVPKDKTKPLKYWTAVVELPPGPNGERRRKPIRRKNKAEVVAELAKVQAELRQRGDLPTANQTTAEWLTYWVDNVAFKKVTPNTHDGYKRSVNNHIIPVIGSVKLNKLTPAHVRRVHDAITGKGLSSTTALLAHRTLSVSLKVAMREGRIGANPAALTDAPQKAATTLEALTLPEAVSLLRHIAPSAHGALWATVLLTGARRGEVLGLERDRVGDFLDLSWQMQRLKLTETDGVPNVRAGYEYRHITGGLYWTRPKSKSSWRIVPLIDPLRTILLDYIAATPANEWGLVFLRNGAPWGPDLAGKDWRKVLQSAGIGKDVRLHDGRHTTVDLLYAAGVPEDLITEIVGHSTRSMTQEYKSIRNRERLTVAMEQFSALFSDLKPAIEKAS